MRVFAFIVAMWIVAGSSVEAGNVFVRDPEQFEKYVTRLAPGDTIVLRSGEEWRDGNLVFEGEGEPGRPIVLAARDPGKTVFTGQSRLRILGKHLVVTGLVFRDGSLSGGSVISIGSGRGESAQECRLTDTAIIDYNPEDSEVNYKWVSVYGRRNRVDHCYFKGQTHVGQAVVVWLNGEPNNHRIDHNYFAGRPNLGRNGGETIRIGTSARSMEVSQTVVEDNLFENCDGEAEIISVKSCENVIRRNAFVSSAGTVSLRHGNRNRVEGNWFVGNGKARSGGVRVMGEGHVIVNNHLEGLTGRGNRAALTILSGVPDAALNSYWQVKNVTFAHNTVIDCAAFTDIAFGHGQRGRSLAPVGIRISANVVQSTNPNRAMTIHDATADVSWDRNLWTGPMTDLPEGFAVKDVSFIKGAFLSELSSYSLLAIPEGDPRLSSDIDGQRRLESVAGSDVGSDAPTRYTMPRRPLVGPKWMD